MFIINNNIFIHNSLIKNCLCFSSSNEDSNLTCRADIRTVSTKNWMEEYRELYTGKLLVQELILYFLYNLKKRGNSTFNNEPRVTYIHDPNRNWSLIWISCVTQLQHIFLLLAFAYFLYNSKRVLLFKCHQYKVIYIYAYILPLSRSDNSIYEKLNSELRESNLREAVASQRRYAPDDRDR